MRTNRLARLTQLYFLSLACVFVLLTTTLSAPEESKGPGIGIDLGTTYSCVGIFKNGRVQIIPNDQGNRITPSYVAFTSDGERLVGEAAKNQATVNPENTAYSVKRLIGRKYNDETVQSDKKFLSYEILPKDGKPYIRMMVSGSPKDFAPEEISSMVLLKMKQIAVTYLGYDVVNAVVTVPAYFNDSQRQATKDAGIIAGLNVLRIINEPTAAAIAYGLDKKSQDEIKILVYDLGGGTFDVSLLSIEGGVFEVIAVNGDTHLGGEDFDQRVIDHFISVVRQKHGHDLSTDKRAVQKLKREVEVAKRTLSSTHQVTIEIEQIIPGYDFVETLSRVKFEELNNDLFKKTLEPLRKVLEDAHMTKEDVDEIVFVGGSTRIPKVQKLVREFFNGKEPNLGINPDEAIAYGAAVEAGILVGETSEEISDVLLIDVTPLTLGIQTNGGYVSPVLERGSVIPATKAHTFQTVIDDQVEVVFQVIEGERAMAKDNHELGSFSLKNLRKAPGGQVKMEVTFDIDVNGILKVTAVELGAENKAGIVIENNAGRLSREEIERMIQEAEKFSEQDKAIKAAADAKIALEFYMHSVRNLIEDPEMLADNLKPEEKVVLKQAVEEVQNWLDDNPLSSRSEFQDRLKDLEKRCDPIITQYAKKHEDTSATHDEL